MDNIRAILYDLDGTLRFNQPSGREFFANRAQEIGLPITPEARVQCAIWEHQYWASSEEVLRDRLEFPASQAFWGNYSYRQLVSLGIAPEQAATLAPQLTAYMDEFYHPEDLLFPDLHQTLAALREAGYILGVVSNREEPFSHYLEKLGLAGYFHFVLAAGEVESWKPAPEIFEHALRMAKVAAHEAVYVGDNYFADIVGAKNAGLNPILIDTHGVFAAPDCLVIQTHAQILALLGRKG